MKVVIKGKNGSIPANIDYKEFLKSEHWANIRKIVLQRDDYKCITCGATEGLHVHHSSYDFNIGDEENNLDLLETQCASCHHNIHKIEKKTTISSKKGWTKMYRIEYDRIAREMTSRLEYDIMAYIRDSHIPKTTAVNFKISKITKDLDTTRNTVSKVVKKLRDLDFIRKVGNTYFMNPFIYIPPMVNDMDQYKFQEEWKELGDDK
mgnify:CR=1 FL=1